MGPRGAQGGAAVRRLLCGGSAGQSVLAAATAHTCRYHGLLQKRAGGLRTIASLQQQNQELRQLLQTYLVSDVNNSLKVPPTATM